MTGVAILGSTGTIGINTLNVVERFSDQFKVVGLTAYNNFKLLEEQIQKFSPRYIAVCAQGIDYLKKHVNRKKHKILDAASEIADIASAPEAGIVVIGIRGPAALMPFLAAVRAGKRVAPANKEAIVMAGHILMAEARRHKAEIIPVDSEQSAIFQCLAGHRQGELKKVYLTASGGPLREVPAHRFDRLSVKDILRHPRWKMGKKITVDSATLMNKGLEVIEAQWLFGLKVDQIEVIIHPQAVIHSMVEFQDGSILAQLGITDMRLPIQYALTYPHRRESDLKPMDFFEVSQLNFKRPDFKKFPALGLCFEVARQGGTLPCVLNAANEEAVEAFLDGRLVFSKIYDVVERVVRNHKIIPAPRLDDIWSADRWARGEAKRFILN